MMSICDAGGVLLYFCGKNKGGCLLPFVAFKNAVLALQILCMMGTWMFRWKLAYAWTGGWTSSAFLCSFVLIICLHPACGEIVFVGVYFLNDRRT